MKEEFLLLTFFKVTLYKFRVIPYKKVDKTLP